MDAGGRRSLPAELAAPGSKGSPSQRLTVLQAWAVRMRLWRSRQIASPRFRALIARLPLLRAISHHKANQLFRLTSGFVHTQVLSACVKLELFEALDGRALSSVDLAARCSVPLEQMQRLLHQARRLNLILLIKPDLWMLTDAGTVLSADRGLREMIRHHDMLYRDLSDSSAFFRGERTDTELRRYWAYVRERDASAIRNDDVAAYSALMRESQAMLADCILTSLDFSRYRCLLDIGGGEGAFLAAVGSRNPELRLALFDLPAVAARARHQLGEQALLERSEIHGGDFTVDPIPTDCDCVTLIRILCDHDDSRVDQILSNLHTHLKTGTRLVVAEAMAGDSEGAKLAALYFDSYFAAMGSGRCRSPQEIKQFLTRNGFRNVQMVGTTNPLLATIVIGEI